MEKEKPEEVEHRPSFPEIYMQMAFLLARRSTCRRLSVGTVIASAVNRPIRISFM